MCLGNVLELVRVAQDDVSTAQVVVVVVGEVFRPHAGLDNTVPDACPDRRYGIMLSAALGTGQLLYNNGHSSTVFHSPAGDSTMVKSAALRAE